MKIIVLYNSENIMFQDFLNIENENIILLDYYISISRKNKLLKAIRRILCSNKINSIVKIPFKQIWSTLNKFEWNKDEEYLVFFCGIYSKHLDPKYLLSLQEKYNIKYAIVLLDSYASPYSNVSRYYIERIPFEHILTFDPVDAKKYNYHYYDGTFYSMSENKEDIKPKYDLYYVARNNPGRLNFLKIICELMTKNNVSSKLRLHGVPSQKQVYKDKIIYNEFIQYDSVINEVKKCNCILEMLIDGQSASTQRYYEAVCYNKKLLTTNKNIVNLPFYDPRYMKVFENPEDIDWEWVKERIPVDYHYDGRFSPTHLIDKIIELEEEREKKENVEKENN